MKKIESTALLTLGLLLSSNAYGAEIISRISLFEGLDEAEPDMLYDLGYSVGPNNDPDTFLNLGIEQVPVKRYEGQFRNRKATGFGRLFFGALKSGQHAFLPYYYGTFQDGLPNGYGELSNYGNGSLTKGNFVNGLPDGVTDISFEDRFAFRVYLKQGVLSDGPVQILRYPDSGRMPSSIFSGVIKGPNITGNWSPLPWTAKTELGQITAYNNQSTYVYNEGARAKCIVESYENKSTDIKSVSWNMPFKIAIWDPIWSGKRIEHCWLTDKSGWSFEYRANRWTDKLEPIACRNAAGQRGVFSFLPDKSGRCDIAAEKRNNNFFAVLWRGVESGVDHLIHPLTELGEEWDKLMCGLVGKRPGPNCGTNVSFAGTFDLPTKNVGSTEQVTKQNLERAKSAKGAVDRIAENSEQGAVSDWAQIASRVYELCATKCQNEDRREYSLQRILQIEAELKSGFESDLRFRRLASLEPDLRATIDRVVDSIPVASKLYQAYRGLQHLNRLEQAKEAIENLPTVDFAGEDARARQKALVDINRIGLGAVMLGEIYPGLGGVWQESFEAMFPPIPSVPAKIQYAVLVSLGLKVQLFVDKYKKLKTADAWYEAVIDEKLKPLGARISEKN